MRIPLLRDDFLRRTIESSGENSSARAFFDYRNKEQCGDTMVDELIESMFRKNYKSLRIYATSILGNPNEADDMVQEVFKIVTKKASEMDLTQIEQPKLWLQQILRNVISNYRRVEGKRSQREVSIETVLEGELITEDDILALRTKYAGALPDKDLELVIYIATTKATYQDAADHFDLPSAEACRKRYKKAIKELRKKFLK